MSRICEKYISISGPKEGNVKKARRVRWGKGGIGGDITKITNKKGGGKKVERMRCSPRKWRINAGERERRKHDAKIQQRMMNKPQRVDDIVQ